MDFIPEGASIPPIIGEFSYYDARIKNTPLYIINTDVLQKLGCSCMYSLPFIKIDDPLINSYGKITKILDIFKRQHIIDQMTN